MKKSIIKYKDRILLVSVILWVIVIQFTPTPKAINIAVSFLFVVISVANLLYGLKVRKKLREES